MAFLFPELSKTIIKCFYDAYNVLGYGFLEKVYENALEIELVNYLKASKMTVGYILNFGPEPKFKRLVFTGKQPGKNSKKTRKPL